MLSLSQPTTGAPRIMNNAGMDRRMNLTRKMTLGSPGKMLIAERIQQQSASIERWQPLVKADLMSLLTEFERLST